MENIRLDQYGELIRNLRVAEPLQTVRQKVLLHQRITVDDAILLYETADLSLLSFLSGYVCASKNDGNVYFNKNFHIEPTNFCVYSCRFCSYHKKGGEPGGWELGPDQIIEKVKTYIGRDVTEVHIVGGVHPKWDIKYYGELIRRVKEILPSIHVKAYSAIELEFVIRKANLTYREGLRKLKGYGLDSIPGGGAEIFDQEVREKICPDKATGDQWLAIHEAAHLEGIPSNATMLYGHIESYRHRARHMEAIRSLQDKTGGFNCFIPLKFRAENNSMHFLGETNLVEDLRNYAVSRIFFDNITHIKAYWPMLGKANTKLALAFGVDDIDGTIDDTTKIYSMAGAEDQRPSMTVDDLVGMVRGVGKNPVERDSVYRTIRVY